MPQLDQIDRRLLYELDLDSRQPFSKVARRLKMSKEGVKYRFESLNKRRVIRNATVFSNLPKLGFFYAKVYLRLCAPDQKSERRIIDSLVRNPSVVWVVECLGKYDLIINVVLPRMADFEGFTGAFLSRFGGLIDLYDVSFLTDMRRFPRGYLVGRQSDLRPRTPKPSSIDAVDVKILSILSCDARANSEKIGKEAGLTGSAVRLRIKRLFNDGFIGRFTLNLDYSAFNYTFVKVMMRLRGSAFGERERFFEYCGRIPGLLYLVVGTGVSDVDLDFEVESLKDFQSVLTGLRRRFPGLIREYEILIVSCEKKLDLSGGFAGALPGP